ncbi:MAG: OmpA family protein [Candidatus Latescibacterota bacterium]|nr:MAG: OmpA family protein [Candidatus Latescibacterota bacterium]
MRAHRDRINGSHLVTQPGFLSCVALGTLFCVLMCCVPSAESAIPPFGYQISSRSTAEYFSAVGRLVVNSNQVFTTVGPYYRLRLTPLGTVRTPAFSLSGFEGDTLFCSFQLQNVGNIRDSIDVFSAVIPPSTIGVEDVSFFFDADGDSTLDSGEDDPSFLDLSPGESVDLGTEVILTRGLGGGESYVEVQATTGNDTVQYTESSVFRAVTESAPAVTLHLGPRHNPKALPRGEGSPDDVTRRIVGFDTRTVVFENDVLNEDLQVDVIEIEPIDSVGWPPGIEIAVLDSSGEQLQSSPRNDGAVLVGPLDVGETRTVQVHLTAATATFYDFLDDSLSVRVRSRSLLDTTRINETIDRIVLGTPFNPDAVISIDQTFKENRAAFGDIVTFVVSVTNVSDSVNVDDVRVYEFVQPALDFLASPSFELEETGLVWRVGSMQPGERRETAIKFLTNSRVSRGSTKVIGQVHGTALSRTVSAGPVVNVLRIQNDIFSNEGFVFGDVYIDANGNGARDPGEAGVPSVGVFLESGEYALTDSTGRFTLPYVFAGYRVVRVDESTIPAGIDFTLESADGEPVGVTTERLVHLIPSGHASVSFPLRAKPVVPEQVSREIVCQEMVAVHKQWNQLYQMPAIPSSYFEIGKAYLKTESLDRLDPILEFLFRNPGWLVVLEGHTDSVPIHNDEFASNEELSIARAEAVMRYLTAKGTIKTRVVVRGYGDRRPVATNATREGRAKNRRVEVSFLPPGVSVDDESELRRVESDLQNIGTVEDSVSVMVVWNISTDSPRSMDVDLRLQLPEPLEDGQVVVRCGGDKIIDSGDNRYPITGFAKSRGIECEMIFMMAAADTHLVRDIRLAVEFSSPPDSNSLASALRQTRDPGDDGVDNEQLSRSTVLRPFGNGDSITETQCFTLFSWDEYKNPGQTPTGPAGAKEGEAGNRGGVTGGAQDGSQVQFSRVDKDAGPGHDETTGEVRDRTAIGGGEKTRKSLGLFEPANGSVVSRRDQIEVAARVPLGSRYALYCNGELVSEEQIGRKEIRIDDRLEDVWYYGVKIESGWNKVVLRADPVDGSAPVVDSVTVALSGAPVLIEASPVRVLIPADGQSTGTVWVKLSDELGLPAVNGFIATIVEGDSLVANADENPDQQGLQVTSRDGLFVIEVRPSTTTGRGKIVVESHGLEASCNIAYVPAQRPMFLSGILEGRLGIFNATGSGSPLGLEDFYDGVEAKGETRFFIQGTTYAGINLTARVDSRKRYDDPLLKTLNPERQYPIYGDASEVYYAAPAQGGNYVALERGQSFLRYGDFRSPLTEGEFLSYKRTSTGLNGAIVSSSGGVNGFVTKTDFFTARDEIPGDGTSGYYYLSHSPVVENSINLSLEVRDRYRPEKILEVRPLAEHRDYTVNYFNGAILFKEPVAVTTREFNPVMIVAIYETESTKKGRYLYGIRGDVAQSGRLRLGVSAVTNGGDEADYALYGINGDFTLGWVDLSGEFARSEDDITGEGSAYRFQVGTKKLFGEHSFYLRRVDGDFQNPSFKGSGHELFSRKAGFDSRFRISKELSLVSSGYSHRFENSGKETGNIDAIGTYEGSVFTVGAGARAARQEDKEGERESFLTILGGGVKIGSRAEFRTHWEKNLNADAVEEYPDRLKSALTVPFYERHKVVATHEYLSAHNRPATHQLLAGVESRVGSHSKVYSKYSMNRTASDERTGAITGLKQQVPMGQRLMGSLDVEGFRSFSSRREDEYVAVKAGLSRLNRGVSLVEGHYEYRWQTAATRHLVRANALRQFENGMAVFFKDALSFSLPNGRRSSIRNEGRIAGAYRPLISPVQALLMLKTEYDRHSPIDPDAIIWKTVLSTDVNVVPKSPHELRLKLAVKRVEDWSAGISSTSNSHLVLGQYVYRFAKEWDVDVWGRYLGQGGSGTRQFGSGIELGRTFYRRVRIAAGYSIGGFEDRDFSENDAWSNGFGARVQLILSDWMFDGFQF